MLPIKIINRSANKYQLAKHNVTDTTKYKDWLFIYPLKRGNLPPGVNLPQIKKCCLRLITNNLDYKLLSTSSLYEQLSILKLSDIHKHEVASFMCKFSNKSTPQAFTNYFVKTDSVHSTKTRHQSDGNFCILRYRPCRLQRSMKYCGVKSWYSISLEIKKRFLFQNIF